MSSEFRRSNTQEIDEDVKEKPPAWGKLISLKKEKVQDFTLHLKEVNGEGEFEPG